PIFSGGSTRNQVKTAQIDRDIAMAQLETETARSKAADELLMTEYQQSLLSTRAAQENFLLNEENSQLALQKYQQGVISLDAYFRAFDEYLKAENAYLNSLSVLYTYHATLISRK
ncbi:MAG: TolC family protein, partial [Bacteroidota bacterium]